MRRLALVLSAVALGGCGSAVRPSAPAAPARAGTQVLARTAHLHPGAHGVRLMAIAGLGRLVIACDRHGGGSAAFVGAAGSASADAVVQSGEQVAEGIVEPGMRFAPRFPGAVRIEQWRLAAFSEAHAPVLTMTVAMRTVDQPPQGCAISAQATVSRPAAGTLTR